MEVCKNNKQFYKFNSWINLGYMTSAVSDLMNQIDDCISRKNKSSNYYKMTDKVAVILYFKFACDCLSVNAEHRKLTWDIEKPFVSLQSLFTVLTF